MTSEAAFQPIDERYIQSIQYPNKLREEVNNIKKKHPTSIVGVNGFLTQEGGRKYLLTGQTQFLINDGH